MDCSENTNSPDVAAGAWCDADKASLHPGGPRASRCSQAAPGNGEADYTYDTVQTPINQPFDFIKST
ncbi:MAG: hypothetical protein M5U01_42700 [Ardenticatenaceae bacterium]|nr:hypothetical protein [Ardenticatenaceae bacterium]